MQKKSFELFVFFISMLFIFSWGQDKDFKQIREDIRQIVESFSKGSLNKDNFLNLLGKNVKIYLYDPDPQFDPDFCKWNREDRGNFFVQKGELTVSLIYSDKNSRDHGLPPSSVIFKNSNGFPISILVEIFGKWTYYTNEKRSLTKYPGFRFEKKINEKKKIDVSAIEIFGPYENPMKCVCLSFGMSIEEIKQK
jgi:hypothetical protein